ncbi:MAG: hypothetical protein IJE68_05030 [Clostridia bacterium]|nr:hypothetical protein [Clostridia bacterium]
MKKIILIIVAFIIGIVILVNMLNTSNGVSKVELEQKGYSLLGYDYCTTDHSMEVGGDAFTEWKCELCGIVANNPDTNTPELCGNCARITGRCHHCGKLEK